MLPYLYKNCNSHVEQGFENNVAAWELARFDRISRSNRFHFKRFLVHFRNLRTIILSTVLLYFNKI